MCIEEFSDYLYVIIKAVSIGIGSIAIDTTDRYHGIGTDSKVQEK